MLLLMFYVGMFVVVMIVVVGFVVVECYWLCMGIV